LKSTVEEIRERFDNDVERFSNVQTGQMATVDAPLALELIAQAAAATTPQATELLDIGCGAGNYSLKLLEALPALNVTLVDLSQPMLDRAVERLTNSTSNTVIPIQSDIRTLALGEQKFDIIVAAAVLHHLRGEEEWMALFQKLHISLRPGGSLWIFDLITHEITAVHALMWKRYGQYLTDLRDETYRDDVFAYIEKEDSPRSLIFQLDMLRQAGFTAVDVLHKNAAFAAFGAVK
jgi:tRNA (cmo5U34)-methyltransferase